MTIVRAYAWNQGRRAHNNPMRTDTKPQPASDSTPSKSAAPKWLMALTAPTESIDFLTTSVAFCLSPRRCRNGGFIFAVCDQSKEETVYVEQERSSQGLP